MEKNLNQKTKKNFFLVISNFFESLINELVNLNDSDLKITTIFCYLRSSLGENDITKLTRNTVSTFRGRGWN